MKLYATIGSERAAKGQGGNNYIDIDLFDGNKRHLARLSLRQFEQQYVLLEDPFYRSENLVIEAARHYKGEKEKGDTLCMYEHPHEGPCIAHD